jgi:hypothetical protein
MADDLDKHIAEREMRSPGFSALVDAAVQRRAFAREMAASLDLVGGCISNSDCDGDDDCAALNDTCQVGRCVDDDGVRAMTDEKTKTLGQNAYEAHEAVYINQHPKETRPKPVSWGSLSGTGKKAWEAAAQAVKRAVLPSSPFSERRTQDDEALTKARDAVVEAAKEWKKEVQGLYEFDSELCNAIQALEELEQ